ncbi:DUF3140 domain-containing protein [Actinomadura rudentiformis]|uniref:DUF3140 domain-containing protein n=1 Tax=Actinomadura rudentiformis TaxID=359158 RepID=A0A6H9Z7F1_9ACTN|nr:DUF3140 domain-containing protein [Actinomadura rudentiformis]KAB2350918.1 DUF3140 domain-containing protein [Actinomadura rudentiformis]
MKERIPGETELLWEEFHQIVNMTSDELRTWLLTDASGEDALPADPDLKLPELGTRVIEVLRKRKVDLTAADTETMRQVVDFVEDKLDGSPAGAEQDDHWRRELMTVGHDPLKPTP